MEVFESNLTVSGTIIHRGKPKKKFNGFFSLTCMNKMIPSKSKKNESRRSSILKPRKPRQPLQNVNFDSSSNENSPTASKVKRRVSFAEKKHVKEFCHTNEQGTVWDNTYEEHDFNLKGSFVADQNAETESKENTPLYASNNDCIHINSDSNSCYPNNAYLANNQLSQESVNRARAGVQDNDTNCDLDFINPIKSIELSDISQLGYATLPSKFYVSKDAILSDIGEYNDINEECMELPESQSGQTVMTNVSCISKNVKSRNITIYRDSNEENCMDDVANKYYSELYSNNVNSELEKTHAQDMSMELTAPISASLLSSHLYAEEQEEQKHNDINNLDTNYTTSCNNVSMEITNAVPIFMKSATSDLGIPKQISITLQNCENTKWNAANTRNTISSTILQSNIVSEDIISEHTSDLNYANDSMILTSAIQPFIDVTDTDTCYTNNTAFSTSMEMIVPTKVDEKNICNENIVKGNDLRKDQYYATDKTEVFNDSPMEMTKQNFRVNEPISRDDRTIFFHNISMEMTNTMSTKSKQEITGTFTCKSLSEENAHGRKDINISVCFNEGTGTLFKSMELAETVPLYHKRMFHAAHAQSVNKSTCSDHKNNRTKFFNDESMEITKSINILPSNIDKENLKIHESISRNDKTMLFHNVSMEMTTAVSSRNRGEITSPITCKSISKEHTNKEKDMNSSTCFNEGTKLLCKSMEFTEVVPISLHDEETFNTIHTTQATSFSQTLSKTYLPTENSTGVAFQIDTIANKTIQDISMEITAAVPSTLHLTQNEKINKTENLIISKDNKFQHLTNNHQTESRKNITKENFTISKEIVEIKNIRHDELSNTFVTQSPLDNLVHSLDVNLENSNSKIRMSDENGRPYPKRIRSSFMEVQSSQENDVHSFPNTNINYVNDIECNECFIKNMIDHTQVPDSNRRDSLNEIDEYSFLRKSLPYLENSLEELQSIKPPSFVCSDSEEENSFHKIQHELTSSTITDIPVSNTSNQLIINNVAESKCLINSRENVANDFTILREKEKPINIENNQVENCHGNTIMDKIEDNQETNCQVITKTIISDDQFNKSNYYMTENINEQSILLMNANEEKTVAVQNVNHCTSLIIKQIEVIDEDQVDERTYIQKRINEDAKLQNNIKEKRQFSNKKRQEIEECSDHFESTGTIIKNQISPEEHGKNLNSEEIQQNIEQKDECTTERLVTEHVNTIEDVKNISLAEQDPFLTLSQKFETYVAREDCIWDIYYKNIDRKMIVFGFISNSLLIATFLSYDFNGSEENLIKEIKIISRVADDAKILARIVHKLILEKINAETLTNLYRTHQDILPMLNFISQEVKLAMNFMFDLRRLDDLNVMKIDLDKILFVSRSKWLDIILEVTIKVKRFDKLTSNDINICCLLGISRIKETDIKNLIKNVKKDHKFLRRYMNDVKDYINIMEETFE